MKRLGTLLGFAAYALLHPAEAAVLILLCTGKEWLGRDIFDIVFGSRE